MKVAIKLVLIYLLMQILGMLVVTPFAMLYSFMEYGDIQRMAEFSLTPSLLAGFLLMGAYLWKQGYLSGDKQMYSFIGIPYLGWSVVACISAIFLVDFITSRLSFLPDWMNNTFNILQSGWFGIVCIAVLGPVLEELLFRGAITKVLLQRYSPMKAIIFSALIFGISHINPAQVVGACLVGLLLGWLYYKSGSVVPGIIIHILNNSLSVYLSMKYPDVDYISDVMGQPLYLISLVASVILFIVSLRALNAYKLCDTDVDL
ncbi:MAG: CPBP family intramembrane metalloprotease [Bacteroides sp.]|jgi:membrane protease YdiL (CAAX protease family)|nr:CPBP family intramembrane metalloprotease [Bacteroides sp.]MCI1683564.1 CPBP family intramembrane metalloprotease [Bacteroides sp.]